MALSQDAAATRAVAPRLCAPGQPYRIQHLNAQSRTGGTVIVGRSVRTEPPYRVHRGKPVGYTVVARFRVRELGKDEAWRRAREERDRLVLAEFGQSIDELAPRPGAVILTWYADRLVAQVSVHDGPPWWRRPRRAIARTFPLAGTTRRDATDAADLWAELLLAVPAAARHHAARTLARHAIAPAQAEPLRALITLPPDVTP